MALRPVSATAEVLASSAAEGSTARMRVPSPRARITAFVVDCRCIGGNLPPVIQPTTMSRRNPGHGLEVFSGGLSDNYSGTVLSGACNDLSPSCCPTADYRQLPAHGPDSVRDAPGATD